MGSSHSLDALAVQFDDANLVANAGLVLPATLAQHLGLEELYRSHVHLGDAPGRANVGIKAMTPGSQLALYVDYSHHPFITNRPGEMLALEADHRAHAEVEATIRDLKYGMGLNHLPSGRFGANGAWLALNVMAHNLLRWAGAIALGDSEPMTTKTFRRRLVALPGRLARSGRRLTLHLPERWPWEEQFVGALALLRGIRLAV